MADQKVTVSAEAKGFDKVAQQVEKTGAAEDKLAGQTQQAGQAVGLFGDKGIDFQQLINAAILAQMGKLTVTGEMPEGARVRVLEQLIERNRQAIETFRARETAQGQGLGDPRPRGALPTELIQRAFLELRAATGSTTNLERYLMGTLPEGADIEKAVETLRDFPSLEDLQKALGDTIDDAVLRSLNWLVGLFGYVRLSKPEGGVETIGIEEYTSLKDAIRMLERAISQSTEEATKATKAADEEGPRQQTTIHQYHQQHARFTYPDAATRRRHTINGENDRMRRKIG